MILDPICPSRSPHNNPNHTSPNVTLTTSDDTHDATFFKWWDEQKTVPIMLIAVILPLINFKSPTFFTKFNALGKYVYILIN